VYRSCVVCVLVADFDVEEIMEGFTMGMTNDIDKIREITGYEPGKAFIYGFNEEGRVRRECVETYGVDTPGEPVVYATDSKNFHIFPNSMEITDEIKKSEEDLRLKVYKYFIEYCNNNKETFDVIKYDPDPDNPDKWTKLQMSKKENYKNKMIIDKIRGKETGEGCGKINGKNKAMRGLYKYLPFYYNGKIYNINFMRFYIDKDNKVNCIFKQIQFDRTNKENINEDGICYPRTYQNHVNKLDKLIQDNKGKNFCYNPPVAYEAKEAEKAIVEKFVEFVKKCEEYDTK
jgi:hypothetical protein